MSYNVIRVNDHTNEWFKERSKGIGSSEIGTVLTLNEWKEPIQLFYEKVFELNESIDNSRMFWGRELEEKIAENWQYWDGTEDGYVERKNNREIQRKCRNINGILVNDKYPWLRANIDRAIVKGQFKLTDGETEDVCPLEIKTINAMEMRKWESQIPEPYLAQVHQQMLIMEVDYCEIALFDNYRNFQVYPIDFNEEFANALIRLSKSFWYDRVLPAREARNKLGIETWDGDMPSEITDYAPPIIGTPAYRDFLSQRAKYEPTVVAADDEDVDNAAYEKLWNEVYKVAKSQKEKYKTRLVDKLSREGAEKIDLGSDGYFSFMEQSNTKNRVARNQTVFKFKTDAIKEKLVAQERELLIWK